jgi:hypothetical protein
VSIVNDGNVTINGIRNTVSKAHCVNSMATTAKKFSSFTPQCDSWCSICSTLRRRSMQASTKAHFPRRLCKNRPNMFPILTLLGHIVSQTTLRNESGEPMLGEQKYEEMFDLFWLNVLYAYHCHRWRLGVQTVWSGWSCEAVGSQVSFYNSSILK